MELPMARKRDLREYVVVKVDHLWADEGGAQWAFFWVEGAPVLAWEGDCR